MTADFQDRQRWSVETGDCIAVMAAMPEHSVDAVVCDPPYGLGFMGKGWDTFASARNAGVRGGDGERGVLPGYGRGGKPQDVIAYRLREAKVYQEWCEAWGREAYRVLRPGGYILAFGGTRTEHRLTCGLEDAGFEVRDKVIWLYGSGFPKHASCLKPAHEPVALGRKAAPRSEPLQIDACRIAASDEDIADSNARMAGDGSWRRTRPQGAATIDVGEGEMVMNPAGRWPANVALDEEAASMLDEQTGQLGIAGSRTHRPDGSPFTSGQAEPVQDDVYADRGGASRFLYVAKPDTAERNVGLHERNPHPTVKPVTFMRWLCRLITPPGGTVLDPFMGSGTTGIAAMREGFSFIGIDQDAEYVDVARARIIGDAPLLNGALEEAA